jgi:hypothetical protein
MQVLKTVITLAICWLPAAYCADESAPVGLPNVKVGDSWTYSVKGIRAVAGVHTVQILKVVNGNLFASITQKGTDRDIDMEWTPEWNSMGSGDMVFDRPNCIYQFPLTVGNSWECSYMQIAGSNEARRHTIFSKGKVARWEDVTVPAGKYRALRVEMQANFKVPVPVRGTTELQEWISHSTHWYVPEIKKAVRINSETKDHQNRLYRSRSEELVGFELR